MKKISVSVITILIFAFALMYSGNVNALSLPYDSIKERDRSIETLRQLRGGCIIVRLKTNDRSVAAYRRAGKNEIADKVQEARKKTNEKIYDAFMNNMTFCNVYFIYANETKAFEEGNHKIFLNADLQHDTTIVFTDTFHVWCEYGSAEPYSKYTDNSAFPVSGIARKMDRESNLEETPSGSTTDATASSSLVLYDANFEQFQRPFPYAVGVYLDGFSASVRTLNSELEKTYFKLVMMRDMKQKIKQTRKEQDEKIKEIMKNGTSKGN